MKPFSSPRLLPLVAVVLLGGPSVPSEVNRVRHHAMLGAGKVDNDGAVRRLGITNGVIGGIATLVGISGLVDRSQQGAGEGREPRRALDVGVTVSPDGAPGLRATIRF